jgi:tetratricopeptide (TPR) repeat protein
MAGAFAFGSFPVLMLSRLAVVVLLCVGLAAGPAAAASSAAAPPDTTQSFSTVLTDPYVRTRATEGLQHLYNLRPDTAEALFQEINARYPEHPVSPFLKGLNLWWRIMLDLTDTTYDEGFYDYMDEVIDRCEDILDERPDDFDALLFKGAAHGFKARLASNRSDWWKALRNGRKAIGPVRRVAELAPDGRGDYVFGKGLYDYYTAILEEEYPAVKAFTWMIPDGNRKRGLRLLKRTAKTGHYVQTEAIYFLTQIYYLYEEEYYPARRYVRQLRARHPDNPYFHNYEGRVYAKWNRWDQARAVFTQVVDRCQAGRPGYNVHMEEIARYYLGKDRLYEGKYKQALTHLDRLATLTDRDIEDNRYRILGALYEGMVFDAMGKRAHARRQYEKVLDMDDPVDAHDRAEKYLETPYSR